MWIWVTQTIAERIWEKALVKSVKMKDSTFVKNITGVTKYKKVWESILLQNKKWKPLDLGFVIQTIKCL